MKTNALFFRLPFWCRRKVRPVLESGIIKPTRYAGVVAVHPTISRSHAVLNVATPARDSAIITGRRRPRGGRPLELAVWGISRLFRSSSAMDSVKAPERFPAQQQVNQHPHKHAKDGMGFLLKTTGLDVISLKLCYCNSSIEYIGNPPLWLTSTSITRSAHTSLQVTGTCQLCLVQNISFRGPC